MRPKCIDCGKEINYYSKRCKNCYNVYFGKKQVGKNNPNYKNGLPKCQYCGKIVKAYQNKFCSKKCFGLSERNKNHHNWKNKLNDKKCLICGKTFRHYTNDYCSVKCGRKSRIGNRAPNWLGGISQLPYDTRFTEQLRRIVRNRDNHICKLCGILEANCNKKLCVHHIDYNKKNSVLNNLISLCLNCHMKTNTKREYWKQYFKSKV